MTARDKSSIKAFFETGDTPTQTQFGDLVDSYCDFDSTLLAIASAAQGGQTGIVVIEATAQVTTRSIGAFGVIMVGAATTAAAVASLAITSDERSYTKQQLFAEATLSAGTTVNWPLSAAQTAVLSANGSHTLANPTGKAAGATYILRIKVVSAGATLAYGTDYIFPGSATPSIGTANNSRHLLMCYCGADTKMYCTLGTGYGV